LSFFRGRDPTKGAGDDGGLIGKPFGSQSLCLHVRQKQDVRAKNGRPLPPGSRMLMSDLTGMWNYVSIADLN